MAEKTKCPKCGAELSASAPEGLCVACLMDATVVAQSQPGGAVVSTAARGLLIRYFGDYEVLEEIARGGMGVVFKAKQLTLNRLVALKVISGGALASPDLIQRFKTEAEAAASLDHPNIVPIYEIGEHAGQHYFSMRLIEGMSLGQALSVAQVSKPAVSPTSKSAEGSHRKAASSHSSRPSATNALQVEKPAIQQIGNLRYDLRATSRLVAKIARAVHFAHQRGILHRDIKPNNILLDAAGEPYLSDFGLAKIAEREQEITHTIAVLGTPSYMSPEQARGETKQLTTAADVYGLGAVLYELLTGQPPFAGGTSLETVRQVIEKEPRRPSSLNPSVDRDLETICLKSLRKEPDRRYVSALALAEDLESWLRGEPIRARRITQRERVEKWIRRRPVIAALSAALAIALVAGVVGIFLQGRRAEKQRQAAEAARVIAERNLYAANMNLAQQAWEQNNLAHVRELLEETKNYLDRGFEWYHWQRQLHLQARTLLGSGNWLAWAAFSPDSQRLVTATGWESTFEVWDTVTWRQLFTVKERRFCNSAAFSPQGDRIVTTGNRDATIWDAITGKELLRIPVIENPDPNFVQTKSAEFSPDGRKILVAPRDRPPKVYDALTGDLLVTFEGGADAAAFSPDGHWVVTSMLKPGERGKGSGLQLWHALDGSEVRTFADDHTNTVNMAAFSPDGRRIATAGEDGIARVWETSTGRELLTLRGHKGHLACVVFSHDGRWIATGGTDHTAKIWDAATGRELFTIRSRPSWIVPMIAFSPNGKWIATAGDRVVKLWEASENHEVLTFGKPSTRMGSAAFSPDGQWIVAGGMDPSVRMWNAATGQEERAFPVFAGQGRVIAVAFSRDGKRLATRTVGNGRTLRIWDVQSGEELLALELEHVNAGNVIFSPDGTQLIANTWHGVVLWDTATGQTNHIFAETGEMFALALSPDGQQIVTGGTDKVAKVWDLASRRQLVAFRGHSNDILAAAFSPDGKTIVTGGGDPVVKVWDASTGNELLGLKGHENRVTHAAFSPDDGKRLLTTDSAGAVRLWELSGGRQLLAFRFPGPNSAAFSPDGRKIVATSWQDGLARVWSAASPEQVAAWRDQDQATEKRLAGLQREFDESMKRQEMEAAKSQKKDAE